MKPFCLIVIVLMVLALMPGLALTEDVFDTVSPRKTVSTQDLFDPKEEKELEEANKQHQKQLKRNAEHFRKSLIGGPPGRFQAIPINGSTSIFILDTKEGHMWLWGMGQTLYEGFVYPGVETGDMINETKQKPE